MDEPCTSIQADDELRELHDDIERMKQIIETGEDSQSRSFVGAAESTRQFGESNDSCYLILRKSCFVIFINYYCFDL